MKRFLPACASIAIFCCSLAFAQVAATQPERDPNEIRHGMAMGATTQERTNRFYERMVSRIEPSLRGDVNHLPQYLDFFGREFVEDLRTFAWSVRFDITGDDKAVLKGFVEFDEHRAAMKDFLRHLNLPGVEDQTEVLPSAELGRLKYAVVTAPHAFIYDKPEGKRETLTECAAGDTIYVLNAVAGGLLCHSPSGYVGYIDPKSVRLIDELTLNQIESAIAVQRGSQIETMIAAANKYMGVKYVWGANSADGIDCSGLVYNAFKTIGVSMPRDADQQFLVGRLVATRWHRSGLRRGDTLYFISKRGTIHHTAIYLGDSKFLEAAEPVAKITSLNPKDPNYDEKRDKSFCFGKRVIE